MNDFLKSYGLIIISAVVGLLLVIIGLIAGDQTVLSFGMTSIGTSLGIHLGGHTALVPTKTDDAVAHIIQKGGKVKLPGVTKLTDKP